jgi:hypothetical protein
MLEKPFADGGLERITGIYAVDQGKLPDAIQFLTLHTWSLLVLSARQNILTDANLTQMYGAATTDIRQTRWLQ